MKKYTSLHELLGNPDSHTISLLNKYDLLSTVNTLGSDVSETLNSAITGLVSERVNNLLLGENNSSEQYDGYLISDLVDECKEYLYTLGMATSEMKLFLLENNSTGDPMGSTGYIIDKNNFIYLSNLWFKKLNTEAQKPTNIASE